MPEYRMIHRALGNPEVIEREDFFGTEPQEGEVLVRHRAVGLNFIDTYRRSGLYPVQLPSQMGTEASGDVVAVGPGVTSTRVGDRVAYATGPLGAYSTMRAIPAEHLISLPEQVSYEVGAAGLLKGMTAGFLIHNCARVSPDQTVLVHAAAGGVGFLLVQWLTSIGARVIAHSGSAEKAALAASAGAWKSSFCPMSALAGHVREATDGKGVNVVFDGVGAASWEASLRCVAPRGLVISYGNASGPAPNIEPLSLMRAGSIFYTRPTLADYAASSKERGELASKLFQALADGALSVEIGQSFNLSEAREAHRQLEARRTTRSSVLIP